MWNVHGSKIFHICENVSSMCLQQEPWWTGLIFCTSHDAYLWQPVPVTRVHVCVCARLHLRVCERKLLKLRHVFRLLANDKSVSSLFHWGHADKKFWEVGRRSNDWQASRWAVWLPNDRPYPDSPVVQKCHQTLRPCPPSFLFTSVLLNPPPEGKACVC